MGRRVTRVLVGSVHGREGLKRDRRVMDWRSEDGIIFPLTFDGVEKKKINGMNGEDEILIKCFVLVCGLAVQSNGIAKLTLWFWISISV